MQDLNVILRLLYTAPNLITLHFLRLYIHQQHKRSVHYHLNAYLIELFRESRY